MESDDAIQWGETTPNFTGGMDAVITDVTDVGLGPQGRDVLWELAFLRHCVQRAVNNAGWSPGLWSCDEFCAWLSIHSKSSQELSSKVQQHHLTPLVCLSVRPSDLSIMLGCSCDAANRLQKEVMFLGTDAPSDETSPEMSGDDAPTPTHSDLLPSACAPSHESLEVVEMLRVSLRSNPAVAMSAGTEPGTPFTPMQNTDDGASFAGSDQMNESSVMKSTNALMARELIEKSERLRHAEETISGMMQDDVKRSVGISFRSFVEGTTAPMSARAEALLTVDEGTAPEHNLDVPYVPARSLSLSAGMPVMLNIYNISDSAALPALGLGMYHSGIAIYGKEFAFAGAGTGNVPSGTGVYWTQPMRALPNFIDSHVVGMTKKAPSEVWAIVNKLIASWSQVTYHVFKKNCNHFTSALAAELVDEPNIPSYVNRAAVLGAIFVSESGAPRSLYPSKVLPIDMPANRRDIM
eukprot:PhM_4_TR2736/c0_g1_i1/m.52707